MLVLPGAVWTALFLAFAGSKRPVREAALAAFTGVAIGMLTFTEVLSPFHALSFAWLSTCWALFFCAVVVLLRRRIRLGTDRVRQALLGRTWDATDRVVAAVLLFFAAGTLLSALLYPIVNFDSLTCHSVRVFFWYQNHSIAPYPTSSGQQLFEEPLGAYFVLTMKILAGGSDRVANLVQWLSYVFSLVGVSLIAMRLGASRRGQQAATIAAATIPMAVLQASTTQNDLNVAVWCLTAVYCAITFMMSRSKHLSTVAWIGWTGCALGLALLAKPTAYMFCFPYFVWLAAVVLRRDGLRRMAMLATGALLVALLVNGAWFAGNARILGKWDVMGLTAPGNTQTEAHENGFGGIFTDALKNGSMELGTPFSSLNRRIAGAVRYVIRDYRGTVEDPTTKEESSDTFRLDNRVTNHDVAPSPLSVALIVVAAAALLGYRRTASRARYYLFCGVSGGFLTAELITYNYFVNRLLVGSLLLLTPTVGVALTVLKGRKGRMLRFALIAVLALSVGWAAIVMAFNSTNRLVPPTFAPVSVGNRNLGYWNTSYDDLRFRVMTPDLERPFKAIAAAIREAGVSRVGVDAHVPLGTFPVYPLLSLLSDRQVAYVRDTLFPDKIKPQEPAPQVIVEIVESDEYPQILADGRQRGPMLLPPQRSTEWVLLLYEAR